MDCEKKMITDLFKSFHKSGLNTIKDFNVKYQNDLFDKSYQKSVEARKEGNKLFTETKHDEKVHEEVWRFYCQSIAYAPNKSEELATGYANRSVLLLHLKKYKESLLDIARALKITESSALKVKLFCRQIHCLAALQEGNHSVSMEKAKFWLNKVDDHNEIKKLKVMINKAENFIEENIPAKVEKVKKDYISCDNDSVSISYDEKCGRCLIANRDIPPGEIVYVEKFYATSINTSKLYAYCSHCLAISWALIPCDKCAYYMFCSSDCQDEAWEKYHSIECYSKHVKDTHITDHATQLSIRSLIMGIKEAGSIEKLKDLVNEVDSCKYPITKGFSSDGQFSSDSFKSLYSLSYSKGLDKVEPANKMAFDILLSLAKNTVLFEKKIVQKKLTKNEDAIFIGSLLIRLISIFNLNSHSVLQMNRGCKPDGDANTCRTNNDCCSRGTSISLFTSLINHSCSNNVSMFHTNDGRVVYYALKPIKKNSQIFSAYICNFVRYMKENRQRILELVYEFKCDCTACRLNWPVLALTTTIHQEQFPDNDISIGLFEKHVRLMRYAHDEIRARKSRKTIRAFAKDVELLFEIVKEPTPATQTFYEIMISLIENRYCEVLKVPSTC